MEKPPLRNREKQGQALEESYRRGYHHGIFRAKELLQRLLQEGMPPAAIVELLAAYETYVVVPWRQDLSASSAPPLFDVQDCQRLLRADKERKTQE